MNMLVRNHPESPERVRFTLDDVLRLQADGLFGDVDVELIEGEIYAMPAEGDAHLNLKEILTREVILALEPLGRFGVIVDGTLKLSAENGPGPDLWVYAKPGRASEQRGPDVLLVIEIAVSSVNHDIGLKARLYREHGVREYWVIEPEARVTHVHRLDGAWPAPPVSFETKLTPGLLAGLSVTLAELAS